MLNNLFSPKSVAIIGASHDKSKLGYSVLANVLKYGYRGKVYPVNPSGGKVLNLKCFKSVLEIKNKVDLAVIIVPAKFVAEVLEQCGQKKVGAAVVISAGFKEVGGEGVKMEEQIKEIAAKHGISLLGPNCLGILDSVNSLNASFADGMIDPGKVAFFSQSGAICTAMLDWAKLNNVGFSRFVSLGNKAGVTENDLLEFLGQDKKTEVILGYLEGMAEGRKFMEICREVSKTKPVIILKAGRSVAGQKAITSHTGSLAGSDEIISAALRQAGAIRANSLGELFNYAKLFISQPLANGDRVAVVANAGGPSVMTTDLIAGSNLQLAAFSSDTLKKLKAGLPPAAAIHNPVDVVGDARADRYEKALNIVLSAKEVNSAIVLLTPQTVTEIEKTAEVIIKLNKKYGKPVLASFIGGQRVQKGIEILNRGGVPAYQYPEMGVQALSAMETYRKIGNWKLEIGNLRVLDFKTWKKVGGLLHQGSAQVPWAAAEEILKIYKIPAVKSAVADNEVTAVKLAQKFGYPVVLKVIAPKLIHKTDAGGVAVNLKTAEEVKAGFKKLNKVAKKFKGQILVQPMIKGAKEIIFGLKRDPQFGPVVMFGLGGIYVEVLKDVTFRVAPVDRVEALKMIQEIKALKLLQGARGENGVKLEALADVLVKLSQLAVDFPQIQEMDINPAMATEKGCQVVDIRIMVK